MYILYISINGQTAAWAASTRKAVKAKQTEITAYHPELIWRVHDGSGWCDGSPGAASKIRNEWAHSFEGLLR